MTVRGLFSSLGAGGSLIAAALCAAALVGGIVAFRGDAGDAAEANTGDVTVPAATATGSGSATATGAAAAAGGAARPGPAGAVVRRGGVRQRPARSTPRRGTAPAPRSPGGSPSAPDPQGSAPAAPAPPTADDPAPSVAPPVSLKRTVEQTRDTVAPVVGAAPAPVQPPLKAVGDTVEAVAGTVDQALAPVVGLLP